MQLVKHILGPGLVFTLVLMSTSTSVGSDKITDTLKTEKKLDDVSTIYRDIVVVQRKAKIKKGSFLVNPSFTIDFSDGPQTLYGINFNIGYALSDFWEVYLQTTPIFVVNERPILEYLNEQNIEPTLAEPEFQAGLEVLWLPAYGKDSWGPTSIVRSDTFFKLGIATLMADLKDGTRFSLSIGKTFFLSDFWNLRVNAGGSMLESLIVEEEEAAGEESAAEQQIMAIFEMGLVFYF